MDYGYVLKRAWRIVWRQKVLWLFGLLAALGVRLPNANWSDLPVEVQDWLVGFIAGPAYVPAVIAALLLALLVTLGLVGVNAFGKAALTEQVNHIENGGRVTLKTAWAAGRTHFRSAFLLILLLRAPLILLGAVGLLPSLLSLRAIPVGANISPQALTLLEVLGASLLCLAPAVCLSLVLWLPLGVIQRLALQACVLERRSVWGSLLRMWEVVRGNTGPVLVLASTLLAIGALVFVLLGAPLGLLVTALLTSRVLLTLSAPSAALGIVFGVTAILWLISSALNSVIETFASAFWTVAYRQLTGLGRTGEEDVGSRVG
ncbi:MAG: hypothetical protein JXD18_03305 [Anaerolineae bacterium]|nr:hypothetical protein [Anaerolineae bacterium]